MDDLYQDKRGITSPPSGNDHHTDVGTGHHHVTALSSRSSRVRHTIFIASQSTYLAPRAFSLRHPCERHRRLTSSQRRLHWLGLENSRSWSSNGGWFCTQICSYFGQILVCREVRVHDDHFVNTGPSRQVLVTLNPARPDPTSVFPGRRPATYQLGAPAPFTPRPVGPCFPTHSRATACSLSWILVLPDVSHPWASLAGLPVRSLAWDA